MKKVLVAVFAAALMCSSCHFNFLNADGISVVSYTDEGGDYTETRTPGRFDEIHSYGPFNVYFIQSQESKVVVEGYKEFVDKVTTEVKDDELTISLEKGKYNHLVLKVTVYAPDVEEITMAGSGDISIGTLTAKEVEISFSGSGNGRIEKADVAGKLELSISGSGNIVVNGKAGSVEARISGSGNIGGKLEYGSISKHKSGSGNINFN